MTSRPSTADEKASIPHSDTVVGGPSQPPKRRFGLFNKKANGAELNEKSNGGEDSPAAVPEEPKVPPIGFFQLFRFSTKKEIIFDALALVAAAAAGAAQPLMTLLFGNLTQQFVNFKIVLDNNSGPEAVEEAARNFRKTAAEDATYLVIIGIGMFVCVYFYMLVWVHTAEANAKRIRERYLKAVLRQDISYFDKVGAGEVATRIQTDTHLVQQGMSEKVALVVQFLAAFVTGFALAYARNWRLALAMSSILPCIAAAGAIMNINVSRYMQQSLKFVADAGTIAEEVISTIRTAQAFGSQRVLAEIYNNHILKSRGVDTKAAAWLGGGLSIFFFVLYSSYGLAFYFGSKLITQGRADSGEVINVFMSILIGAFSLAMLAPEMQAVTHGLGAAAKLYATIDRVPNIDSQDPSGEKPETVEGEITLEHVKFSYPSRLNVPVVKDLSISFKAGKTAALVGASGSGKSTVIALIERFYDPLQGSVKLDGRDIKNLNVKWLRRQIGLVSQEPTLFATTIRGNVEHGLIGTAWENSSDDERLKLVKEACIKSNADGFISKLPLGYDTMVGERGFLLSGGQKQRIAIARAIVSDPRILLLDEATSALDTQSEGVVQDALDKAAAGRTTITIAHRLSTIKDADVIYVFGEGSVLEQGSHDELLSLPEGAYARLVTAQKLREATEKEATKVVDSDNSSVVEEDFEKAAQEEIPLGRRTTQRSVASEILAQKNQAQDDSPEVDMGLFQLMGRLAKTNKDSWNRYAIGTVAAVCTGLVYPAFGVVYSSGIDGFSLVNDFAALQHAGDRNALWFFIIAIISTATIGMQNYFFSSAAASLTAKLRILTFKAMLRQDIEFFDKDQNSSGSLTSSLSENPQKVNGLAGTTLAAIVQSTATVIGGAVLGLVFAWKLGLVGIATAPFLIVTGYIRLRVVVLKDQANKRAHEDSAQLACEAAGAIRTVASLTREDDCLDLYSQSLEAPLQKSSRTAVWSNLLYAFTQATSFWVIALIFWYGAILVSRQEVSTFAFFIALMGTTFGAIQAGNVFSFVPDISSARGAGAHIIKLLDYVPNVDAESSEGKPVDVKKAQGHIRLENVHFRYPTRPGVRVLRDMTLEVQPGKYIALVGQSGCGKSTVIQMIERFYDPLAGKIYMDGELIDELNINEYRKQIALVSQEPTLYAGTVRFNVLLGAIKPMEEVTQEEIEKACRDANILDFIQSLPDGFDTEVGGKGSQLSGGQKQRIAIARALLRNPKVLLLDEATSALDSNSEKVVQAALDQAAKGRTTIAIAHRLSTIQNADTIYFIKEGRVSEKGTHEELLAIRGDYYEFVQLQALSKR